MADNNSFTDLIEQSHLSDAELLATIVEEEVELTEVLRELDFQLNQYRERYDEMVEEYEQQIKQAAEAEEYRQAEHLREARLAKKEAEEIEARIERTQSFQRALRTLETQRNLNNLEQFHESVDSIIRSLTEAVEAAACNIEQAHIDELSDINPVSDNIEQELSSLEAHPETDSEQVAELRHDIRESLRALKRAREANTVLDRESGLFERLTPWMSSTDEAKREAATRYRNAQRVLSDTDVFDIPQDPSLPFDQEVTLDPSELNGIVRDRQFQELQENLKQDTRQINAEIENLEQTQKSINTAINSVDGEGWERGDFDEGSEVPAEPNGKNVLGSESDIDITVSSPANNIVETHLQLGDWYLLCSMYENRYAVSWEAPVSVRTFLDIESPLEAEQLPAEVFFEATDDQSAERKQETLAEIHKDDRFPNRCLFLAMDYGEYEVTWEKEGTHTDHQELIVAVKEYNTRPFKTTFLRSLDDEIKPVDMTEMLGRLSESLDTDPPRNEPELGDGE